MAEDGSAAFCSREESDTWSEASMCWVHPLNGRDLPPPVRVKRIKRDEIPEDAQPEPPSGKEPTAIYDYQDVDGSLLWQVLRFPLPGGKKTFKQRRPDGLDAAGNTRWRHNLEGVRMVPYRLPEIVETADDDLPVFVVEGEKDVETLRSLGLVATTNMGGAGKSWLDTYSEYLIGRTCYIIPDNDEDGRRHAKAVQRSLENATARAIIVSLGLIENKGDVTDWVDNGGTTDQLAKLCAVEDERYERARQRRNRVEQMTAAVLRNQEYEDVRWIIPGIMPEGTTLFAGKPKVGKSWLVLDMALAVARGGTLFDNTIPVQQGAVLYLALEDTFRRLKSRLLMLEKEAHPGDENLTIKIVSPSMQNGGLTYIEDFCQTHPDARLIVVDTLGVFRGPPGKGAGGYLEDYAIFQMLKPISDLYNVAFVLVTHTRKSGAGEDGDIFDAVLGSTAQTGGVDTIMVLDRDKDHNVTLHYKGRDVDEDKVRLVKDDDSGRWLLAPQDVRNPMSDARQEMVRILKDAGPLTPMQVVERTGGNPNTVRGTLKKMLASGQVEKVADCYRAKNDTKENGNVRNRPTPGLF